MMASRNIEAGKHVMDVVIDYTNWRGERRERTIRPKALTWGWSKYHTSNQWLLLAFDFDSRKDKEFAMLNIHNWKPAP
jgi:predicted DNA-binding transcriptional regulator YafY